MANISSWHFGCTVPGSTSDLKREATVTGLRTWRYIPLPSIFATMALIEVRSQILVEVPKLIRNLRCGRKSKYPQHLFSRTILCIMSLKDACYAHPPLLERPKTSRATRAFLDLDMHPSHIEMHRLFDLALDLSASEPICQSQLVCVRMSDISYNEINTTSTKEPIHECIFSCCGRR
jgi:hypothetical protein